MDKSCNRRSEGASRPLEHRANSQAARAPAFLGQIQHARLRRCRKTR